MTLFKDHPVHLAKFLKHLRDDCHSFNPGKVFVMNKNEAVEFEDYDTHVSSTQ